MAQGCIDAGSGNCWNTKRTCGKSATNFSMIGCEALQWGHSKSLNSTIRIAGVCDPRAGPSANTSFALSCRKGLGPNGIISPIMASCVSSERYMCCAACLFMEITTSATPGMGEALISITAQEMAGSYPKERVIAASTSSLVGSLEAAADREAGAESALAPGLAAAFWPKAGNGITLFNMTPHWAIQLINCPQRLGIPWGYLKITQSPCGRGNSIETHGRKR